MIAIRRRAGLVTVAAIDAFAETKFLGGDIRQSEVRHIQVSENDRVFLTLRFLAVAQPETKKRHLIAVALAALGLQVSRVVPPLGLEVGMRKMIGGK